MKKVLSCGRADTLGIGQSQPRKEINLQDVQFPADSYSQTINSFQATAEHAAVGSKDGIFYLWGYNSRQTLVFAAGARNFYGSPTRLNSIPLGAGSQILLLDDFTFVMDNYMIQSVGFPESEQPSIFKLLATKEMFRVSWPTLPGADPSDFSFIPRTNNPDCLLFYISYGYYLEFGLKLEFFFPKTLCILK